MSDDDGHDVADHDEDEDGHVGDTVRPVWLLVRQTARQRALEMEVPVPSSGSAPK